VGKYKIVASDLDGTLLNNKMEISERNFSAIEKMNEAGVYFVPASGRGVCELPDALRENGNIRYIITSNGAAIIDKNTGKCDCLYISDTAIKKIFEITDRYQCLCFTHTDGTDYISNSNKNEKAFFNNGANREYTDAVLPFCKGVKDIKKFVYDNPTEMLVFFFKSPIERQKCIVELNEISDITVTTSIENNIEIINSKASKGSAVKRLAKIVGVSEKEVIAVGDNYNDLSFTQTQALTLATSNGLKAFKENANMVICSNNDDVADYILKNFIKNEEK